MGVTEQLARFAMETPAGFMTPALLQSAKVKFFDTIAVMVAGAHHPAGRMAARLARDLGGRPSATLIGHADRSSPTEAGFVNGVAAHAHEYDDFTRGVGHANVVLVPGCIALAESLGVSGLAMLEAYAMGFEITTRVAKGLRPALLDHGWHPVGIVGGQGVAAAGCRMMGLDTMHARMAMGIMASSGSGVRKNVGSMGKAFHVGHGVRSGIHAALLARQGFAVDPDIIEGADASEGEGHQRFGLADTFNGIGNHRLHLMVQGLGQDELELGRPTTMLRMYPGCTSSGAAVETAIALATEIDLNPADIDDVLYECTPHCRAVAPYPEPLDDHKSKFCLPYTMAVALTDRKAGIAQYAEKRVADPALHALVRKIRVQVPDDLQHHRGQWGENGVNWAEMRVTVRLKNGAMLTRGGRYAQGYPEMPASWEDQKAKYVECAEGILSPAQIDETSEMIAGLERLDDLRELTAALAPRPAS
ncbi:MAG TPA: MmgE/PrpD family protein [Bordetella sp.]|nr:MmgE/PrpD family protein [Bordetella sp.]